MINDMDEKIRIQLFRKERTNDLIRANRNIVDKSLNNMDAQLTRGNKNTLSPSFDFNRSSRPYN